MKKPLQIVLDTSIFVNPDSRYLFGKTPKEALNNFLDSIAGKKSIFCYIPPSVYEELMKFLEKAPNHNKMILINKKPPSSYESSIPAMMVYEFIEEMRLRINKGLRIAEKYSRKLINQPIISKNNREKEEAVIKSLRHEYRTALREGVIDSKEDFDLILLAKELDAKLATIDHGLVKWAQKLGINCISAEELKEIVGGNI
ncbi:MAG: RNA ligase partner protein [Candidatus Omnitrophica bacterium]|nr:RNA ligase partner protein [Candidatus Omnitrophota bacterium]